MVAARLTKRIHQAQSVDDLLAEFLPHESYHQDFCAKLISLARQRRVAWETRCLAILMAEHQILKLQPSDVEAFDHLFTQLKLKQPGLSLDLTHSVLREGFSTTKLDPFIHEFQQRLARLNRVHNRIQGSKTSPAALQDFVETARSECKLTLARYLFTPEEVVARIVKDIRVSEGVKDLDLTQPRFVDAELAHAINHLPDFEARILRCLSEGSKIYWADDRTSSRINSLVEYPLTTVVLTVKPPGSDHEFEIKRAGRRGSNPLSVVFRRNGNRVPGSHRLDGGSMQWLLRYEARSAATMSAVYRLVHGTEAPMPGYVLRTTVFTVPTRHGPIPAFRYFTEPQIFGESGYQPMRDAMKEAVALLKKEEGGNLPNVGGALGLTAEFLSHIAPAQAILTGTSSFRIDKLGVYLSAIGAQRYFNDYLGVEFVKADAKRFADTLLEEVLGVYEPPKVALETYEGYLDAALKVESNRARANENFLSLVRQIAKFWGTLMAARGHSRGESFVARNVGLRSVWEKGEWRVKLIFMDHDALSVPDLEIGHFFAQNVLRGMLIDERHVWGRANPALFPTSVFGYLMSIYRIGEELEREAQALAHEELKAAYDKTHQAMLNDPRMGAFFSKIFLSRLFDWDKFARGYLGGRSAEWKAKMKQLFAEKGYEANAFEYYIEAVEKHPGFLERNAFLYQG